MKKIVSVLLVCILLMTLLTACGKKEIDAATFTQKASALGYKTLDFSEAVTIHSIKNWIIVEKEDVKDTQWHVEFMKNATEGDAKVMYNAKANSFEKITGATATTSAFHTESYEKTGGGRFMYVCRVNTTVLEIDVKEKYKAEAEILIKEIGY